MTLRPWAEAVIRVAREKSVPVIDLNAKSYAAVAAMGTAGGRYAGRRAAAEMPLPEGVKAVSTTPTWVWGQPV